MDKYVLHWLERSNYDLDTAKAMLDARRYLYVAYMCQQAVEKLLKAIIAQHGKENLPIHNLNRLAELAELSDELEECCKGRSCKIALLPEFWKRPVNAGPMGRRWRYLWKFG